MLIIEGIGIAFLVILGLDSKFFMVIAIVIMFFGLAIPFANSFTGKNSFEYKRKKSTPVREEHRELEMMDGIVEAYDKDTLAYTVRQKFNY
ncbi:MAG: hypothetical protein FK733_06005 [Asgard group archaeon]|nr:hypothetical protein [Asgard group archaeon]